jgi:hypothetical protein
VRQSLCSEVWGRPVHAFDLVVLFRPDVVLVLICIVAVELLVQFGFLFGDELSPSLVDGGPEFGLLLGSGWLEDACAPC